MSPSTETQEPYAIAVLLQYDLVLIDLLTPGFPCFESPYPMDLHESPVTCCTYLTDCPSDLVPAFYSVSLNDLPMIFGLHYVIYRLVAPRPVKKLLFRKRNGPFRAVSGLRSHVVIRKLSSQDIRMAV